LVSLWQPIDTACIPRAIIVFLNRRESESGLKKALLAQRNTKTRLWSCFPRTLSEKASDPPFGLQNPLSLRREDWFTALWRLASLDDDFLGDDDSHLASIESVLDALSTTESRFTHINHSIVALLKMQMLRTMHSRHSRTLVEAGLNHHVFPTETAIEIPDELNTKQETDEIWEAMYNFKRNRISEASICVVAEYLEHCTTNILPYNPIKTLHKLPSYIPHSTIHHTHQLRLANSVQAIFDATQSTELLNGIINFRWWSLYADGPKTEVQVRAHREKVCSGDPVLWPWLDHPSARKKIKDAFAECEERLMLSQDLTTLTRLQNILLGLDIWHPEAKLKDLDPEGGPYI
jgi:hypothetical protein